MNASETRRLESAIDSLSRAIRWLKSDRIEICSVGSPPGIAYTNREGRSLQTLSRECGSDLQLAENALRDLESLRKTRGFEALKAKGCENE